MDEKNPNDTWDETSPGSPGCIMGTALLFFAALMEMWNALFPIQRNK